MAEHVEVMLSEEEVDKRIQEIGDQISKDYAGKTVHIKNKRISFENFIVFTAYSVGSPCSSMKENTLSQYCAESRNTDSP